MEDFQHVSYSQSVIEFVAVAKEFCDFVESTHNMEQKDYLSRLQKFLPLIYLKGSLLPKVDCENMDLIEDYVSESDYNSLFADIRTLLGEYDEYLEVFDDNMQYSEEPVVNSIAEKVCDIYQDLKNFTASYRSGLTELMEAALWELNSHFEDNWGRACAGVLRAVHKVLYQL